MNFEAAKQLLLKEELIRRKAWRQGTYISIKEGDRFITLTVQFKALGKKAKHKRWEPYVQDFIQYDWELYSGSVPKVVPKSRYEREPVI